MYTEFILACLVREDVHAMWLLVDVFKISFDEIDLSIVLSWNFSSLDVSLLRSLTGTVIPAAILILNVLYSTTCFNNIHDDCSWRAYKLGWGVSKSVAVWARLWLHAP